MNKAVKKWHDISLKGETYTALRELFSAEGPEMKIKSLRQYVEVIVSEALDRAGEPKPEIGIKDESEPEQENKSVKKVRVLDKGTPMKKAPQTKEEFPLDPDDMSDPRNWQDQHLSWSAYNKK